MTAPDQAEMAQLEAAIVTDKGTMVVVFFPDKAPNHVRNWLTLAQQGFYDGVAFHRVIRNFMIQTGCPNTRDGATGQPGTGGPGHRVMAEFNDTPHTRGVLSMARGQDPNSAGSQFFVVHANHARHLDGQYTAFGRVVAGLEVLDQIAGVECDFGPIGERSVPRERVVIRSIEIRPRQERAEDGGDGDEDADGGGGARAAEAEA